MSGGEASWVAPSGRALSSPAPSYIWILPSLGDASAPVPTRWISFDSPPTELHPYSICNLSSIKAFRPTGMLFRTLKTTVLALYEDCIQLACPSLGSCWKRVQYHRFLEFRRERERDHFIGAQFEGGKAVGEVGLVSLKRLHFSTNLEFLSPGGIAPWIAVTCVD